MQTLLWPAASQMCFSRSLPISIPLSIPLSTPILVILLTSRPLIIFVLSEYPNSFPSSNAYRQTIPNAELGGESLARPMSRSMEAGCVMSSWTGDCGGDGEAGPSEALESVGLGVCNVAGIVSFHKVLLAR